MHAFADSFDQAYSLRHDLRQMLGIELPLMMLTDSDSLFKVITSSSSVTSEKRLMIDLRATREAYERK